MIFKLWQRIQSLFLLLAVTSLVTGSFLPFYAEENKILWPFFIEDASQANKEWMFLGIGYILSAMACVVTFFLYKCRKDQLRGCAVCVLLIAVTFLGGVYYVNLYFGEEGRNYTFGAYALVAALLFTWLARTFIRKDEKRVRDAHRLR